MRMKLLMMAVLLLIIPFVADAQGCAMCKAVVETSSGEGSAVADGLNSGIVYLMFFPYLLMGAVGFAIYRHRKKRS